MQTTRSAQAMIGRRLSGLLDLFYPPYCLGCGHPMYDRSDGAICRECLEDIDHIQEPRCPKCSAPLGPHSARRRDCPDCRGQPLRFKGTVAVARYDGVTRALVHAFKYGGHESLHRLLGGMLAQRLSDFRFPRRPDIVVPVPLAITRRIRRGFNQAELLAEHAARSLALPLVSNSLKRRHATASQARLSAAERRVRQIGSFKVSRPEPISGRHVLLVDDVLTTGSTASECARVLRAAGAKSIFVAVLARNAG